ncbi:MAG: glycosyltransferase family 39 protein [Candidatus Hinthialibacter antarcticus]|nr:glycosyltransferase family 39 protein [Candidatus Hinthialibacter antarcticus]
MNQPASTPGWTMDRLAMAVVWFGLALYAAIFIYHGAALIAHPYDLDNSEGFLLYQSARFAEGQFLYPPLNDAPYLVDNYPPVYPLVGAVGVKLFGVNFFWLRAVSLIATVLTAALLGVWTHQKTRSRGASILAGLIFLSFYHVYQWGALARVDALGLLFCVAALVVFERNRHWGYAVPLLLLALFTKQSLFAAPLAIGCCLAVVDWKRALNFIVALAVGASLLWAGILLLSGGRAWEHLVAYNANAFYWTDVWINFRHWIWMYTVWGCAPIAVLLFDAKCVRSNDENASPLLFWFTLGAIGEALLCGKIGSAPNYFLALAAAAAVGCGVVFAQVKQLAQRDAGALSSNILFSFFVAAFLLQLIATVHWPAGGMDFAPTPTRAETQAGRLMQNRLEKIDGPVLSDLCGLPLLAGRAPVFQPFICTQLALEGKWNQQPFLDTVRNRAYPALLLRFDLSRPDWDRRRFTEEMIASFREAYVPSQQYGAFYLYTLKP